MDLDLVPNCLSKLFSIILKLECSRHIFNLVSTLFAFQGSVCSTRNWLAKCSKLSVTGGETIYADILCMCIFHLGGHRVLNQVTFVLAYGSGKRSISLSILHRSLQNKVESLTLIKNNMDKSNL